MKLCFSFRLWSCALAAMLMLVTSGCSTFNRDWKRAGAQPLSAQSIEGPWDGQWLSQKSGHSGQLRCLISRQEADKYQARFHAKYWRILSFSYTVLLDVRATNGLYQFQGDANLGRWAGGMYHYEGEATSKSFSSRYRSTYDYGTFQMSRP